MKIRRIAEPLILCLVGMGLFPIVDLNPESPVELGRVFRLLVLAIGAWACVDFGRSVRTLFPKWTLGHTAVCSAGIACLSLLLRFFLEFGEVSNTYNFTVPNVAFHILFVTLLATGSAMTGKE